MDVRCTVCISAQPPRGMAPLGMTPWSMVYSAEVPSGRMAIPWPTLLALAWSTLRHRRASWHDLVAGSLQHGSNSRSLRTQHSLNMPTASSAVAFASNFSTSTNRQYLNFQDWGPRLPQPLGGIPDRQLSASGSQRGLPGLMGLPVRTQAFLEPAGTAAPGRSTLLLSVGTCTAFSAGRV